jgi:putative ABC transport system permease protein
MHDVMWTDAGSAYAQGGPQILAEAATPEFFLIKDLILAQGRPFSEQEDAVGSPVIVIGQEVAERYFPNLDPIGREIRVHKFPFTVIGVLEKQGTVFGFSLDRQVIAPFHSEMSRLTHARNNLYGVVVQAPTPGAFNGLHEIVRELMRKRHKLRPAQEDDFVLESSESALGEWQTIKKYMVLAGTVLPAIGLVVGAIVIMNIMLVAVAERTREIGIRKSLGARRRDILNQFLVESATLSTVGAMIGILLGILIAKIISWNFSALPASVAPWSIVVATLLGTVVGIVSGVVPARRASRLDPIEALRQE